MALHVNEEHCVLHFTKWDEWTSKHDFHKMTHENQQWLLWDDQLSLKCEVTQLDSTLWMVNFLCKRKCEKAMDWGWCVEKQAWIILQRTWKQTTACYTRMKLEGLLPLGSWETPNTAMNLIICEETMRLCEYRWWWQKMKKEEPLNSRWIILKRKKCYCPKMTFKKIQKILILNVEFGHDPQWLLVKTSNWQGFGHRQHGIWTVLTTSLEKFPQKTVNERQVNSSKVWTSPSEVTFSHLFWQLL